MLQHGNYVRIDTSNCQIPECVNGCAMWHKRFNGALGTVHGDVRDDHQGHDTDCDYKNPNAQVLCLDCETPAGMTLKEHLDTHHLLVMFGKGTDEIALFSPSEIEDLGPDYIGELVSKQMTMAPVFETVPVVTHTPH